MHKILTELDTFDYVDNIVSQSKRFVVIISPYVNKEYIEHLMNIKPRSVFMQIYCLPGYRHRLFDEDACKELDAYLDDISKYYNNSNLIVHKVDVDYFELDYGNPVYFSQFHSKCYFNEYEFIMSSMNLSSDLSKPELGVMFSKLDDEDTYNQLLYWYFEDFCLKVLGVKQDWDFLSHHFRFGACVHCGKVILFNKKEPYCKTCYSHNDLEKLYCHKCGRSNNGPFNFHDRCYRSLCDVGSI